ncbi:MAG: UxaA family hydrolase, partial [Lachnospiraceae bacterium]|nr:UxaA family hydrolase [Lachnospiraceae bacterium]
QMGDDQEHTAMILGRMASHPNCGGVLLLSLGCENNNFDHMKPYLKDIDEERTRFLVCQESGDELEDAAKLIEELIATASKDRREKIPASELIVGLKCGGSDGFSGITANPLVGLFSDMLVAEGGSTILTEVPEMFGAEQLLMNRAADKSVFDKTVSLINDFKDYYEKNNQVIYENPSPGNKAGGITTLEDKSLGCVQKSGSAAVADVLKYGERVCTKGLNLLEGPGNDMVAVTALAAAGAHLILFTTGRGTPLSSPVPTVKVSSNSALAGHKSNWIDFDAGRLVSTGIESAELSKELFDYVLEVASGKLVKSEEAGYHSMTIFKQGVTL